MTDLRSEIEDDLDQVLAEQHSAGAVEDRLLSHELRVQRVRAQARDIIAAERRGPLPPIDAGTVAEVLSRPPEPLSRVESLIPWSASALLTAQRKTGKTTTVLNLARSLLTGEDFLGRYGVRQVEGLVAMVNFEVAAAQLARWAADVGVPRDRLYLVNVRGRRNPLVDQDDRSVLGARLRALGVESVFVDPFGRAYSGASQNDAGEVGSWLTGLDQWARGEVGATDLVLTAHAGWNGERTRGSTALEDWADVIINLTRDDTDEGSGERYLRAIGRDVDVEEDQLHFDPSTRQLTMAGAGSRKVARESRRHDELDAAVLDVIVASPGITMAGIRAALREAAVSYTKGDESKASARLVNRGQVVIQPGSQNRKFHFPTLTHPNHPDPPQATPSGRVENHPNPPLYGGVVRQGESEADPPRTCSACGEAMVLVEEGQTTHPGCDPS